MKVVYNEKKEMLYIAFPLDAANIDSSLVDIWKILQEIINIGELFRPIFEAYRKIKTNYDKWEAEMSPFGRAEEERMRRNQEG